MSYTFLKFRNEYDYEKFSGIVKEEVASNIISFVRFLSSKYEVCTVINNIDFKDIKVDLDDDEILEFIKELIDTHCYDDFYEVSNLEDLGRKDFKLICENIETYFRTVRYIELDIVSRFEMFFN